MPQPIKVQRLKRLTDLSERHTKAQHKADDLLVQRDAAVMAAREIEPATYQEIAEAMGVTKDRVSQIIQAQKRRA
jgi:DNA-directed RNA polymerase specialized sigma subunit